MRGLFVAAAVVAWWLPAGPAAGDDLDEIVKILESAGKGPGHVAAGLAEAAKGLGDKPLLRDRLYEKAYGFGVRDPAGYAAAIEAAQTLAQARPDDRAAWEDKLLTALGLDWNAASGDRKKQAGARLMDWVLRVGDQRLREGNAEEAIKFYSQAFYKAPYCAPDRRAEAMDKLREARQRQRAQAQVDELNKKLAATPADGETRERIIRLLFVELGRADPARKLLTADVGEVWRTYLSMTDRNVGDLPAEACMELGNWYRELAKTATPHGKRRMLTAGRDCYQRFLSLHGERDMAGLKAKVSLAQVDQELKDLPPVTDLTSPGATTGEWVDALALAEEATAWGPGQWQPTAKGLYGRAEKKSSGFMFPLSIEGDCEVRMEYVLPNGANAISLHVPLGRSADAVIALGYGGRTAGLWELGGKTDPEKNGTGVPFIPVAGRSCQLRVSIAQDAGKATVAVQVNGKGLFTVREPLSRFPKPRSDSGDLAVALSDGAVLVKSLQVRAVAGKGRLRATGPVPKEIARAGQWVDLLKLGDKARATEEGKFTFTGQGAKLSAPKGYGGFLIPVRAEGDYEVRAEFSRSPGYSLSLSSTIGGAHKLPLVWSQPGVIGIWRFDEQRDVTKSKTAVPCNLSAGAWHQAHLEVQRDGDHVRVQFTLDGKRVLSLREPLLRFPTLPERSNSYGVGVGGMQTEINVRRLEMKATSPAGRVLLVQDRP